MQYCSMAKEMKIQSRIWIQKEGKSYLGRGRIELLKYIESEGSISKAAKKMHMSYKAAWDNLNQINELSKTPLIESSNGGVGGGGTSLTLEGKRAIEVFEKLENLKEDFFSYLEGCEDIEDLNTRLQNLMPFIQSLKS